MLTPLGEYKESRLQIFNAAIALLDSTSTVNIKKSLDTLKELSDYRDSREYIYSAALAHEVSGEYSTAISLFKELGEFQDSAHHLERNTFAQKFTSSDAYKEAKRIFIEVYNEDIAPSNGSTLDISYDANNQSVVMSCIMPDMEVAQFSFEEMKPSQIADWKVVCSSIDSMSKNASSFFRRSEFPVDCKFVIKKENGDILYTSINGTQNINCVDITELEYKNAIALMENGEFEEADAAFSALGSYRDSEDMRIKSAAKAGNAYETTGDFETAIQWYVIAHEYDKANSLRIVIADKYYSAGDMENAVEWYSSARDFEKANASRYSYVLAHKNRTDETTYKYLQTLTVADYKDASKIYSSLYGKRTVKLIVNTSKTDNRTNKSIIRIDSRTRPYIHCSIAGGPPGNAEVRLAIASRLNSNDSWSGNYIDTSTYVSSDGKDKVFEHYLGLYNIYYKITIYDTITGEQLAQTTLHVID